MSQTEAALSSSGQQQDTHLNFSVAVSTVSDKSTLMQQNTRET